MGTEVLDFISVLHFLIVFWILSCR